MLVGAKISDPMTPYSFCSPNAWNWFCVLT
jgi:hypothetical protein